jgi:hypothetical protein
MMEVNFSAGEAGTVWIHGVPIAEVDAYPGGAFTYYRDTGKQYRIATLKIQNVTIKLVSEDFE